MWRSRTGRAGRAGGSEGGSGGDDGSDTGATWYGKGWPIAGARKARDAPGGTEVATFCGRVDYRLDERA
jgi:hypothetical protein